MNLRNILIGFGSIGLATVGVVINDNIHDSEITGKMECANEACSTYIAYLVPTSAECEVFSRCGGEPCPIMPPTPGDVPGPNTDKYYDPNGALGQGLRILIGQNKITTFHVAPVGSNWDECLMRIELTIEQRAEWANAAEVAEETKIIDAHLESLPEKYKAEDVPLSVSALTTLSEPIDSSWLIPKGSFFTIQVAAMPTLNKANALKAALIALGHNARVVYVPQQRIYAVRVGSFNTKPEAVAAKVSVIYNQTNSHTHITAPLRTIVVTENR